MAYLIAMSAPDIVFIYSITHSLFNPIVYLFLLTGLLIGKTFADRVICNDLVILLDIS